MKKEANDKSSQRAWSQTEHLIIIIKSNSGWQQYQQLGLRHDSLGRSQKDRWRTLAGGEPITAVNK